MSNMYPKIRPENSVILAPGEGKIPQHTLYDNDWDIKAFPHINSPDGKYGLHHDRQVKLSDQFYFIQRICNQNPKFAKSPAYVYAAMLIWHACLEHSYNLRVILYQKILTYQKH